MANLILAVAIIAAFFFALRRTFKNARAGGCAGCSGNCASCAGSHSEKKQA